MLLDLFAQNNGSYTVYMNFNRELETTAHLVRKYIPNDKKEKSPMTK